MLDLRLGKFLGACAAALVAGCGGNVVVEHDTIGNGAGGGPGNGGGGTTETTGGGGTTETTSSSTSTSTMTAEPTPACLAFCEAVADIPDCFKGDDCHARCMSIYANGCTAQAEAFLTCTPQWLSEQCQIGYPPSAPGCWPAFQDFMACGAPWLAGKCQNYGATLVTELACYGFATCGDTFYEIDCDEAAHCTCTIDGELVGSCDMPFTGAEPCQPEVSCCRPFFTL